MSFRLSLPFSALQHLSLRGCRYVEGSFLCPDLVSRLGCLGEADLSFTMANLPALNLLLHPPPPISHTHSPPSDEAPLSSTLPDVENADPAAPPSDLPGPAAAVPPAASPSAIVGLSRPGPSKPRGPSRRRRLRVGMVGTPALFELAFTYSHRSELESLLLRLQVAINAAHLQDTRECLTLVRPHAYGHVGD